jgi:hypothetical protein
VNSVFPYSKHDFPLRWLQAFDKLDVRHLARHVLSVARQIGKSRLKSIWGAKAEAVTNGLGGSMCVIHHEIKRSVRTVMFACMLFLLGACATPIDRLDSNNSLPAPQIATLTVNSGLYDAQPILRSVDGRPIDTSFWTGSTKVEIAPGHHRLAVGFHQNGFGETSFSVEDQIVEFDAVAGQVYELRVTTRREGRILFGRAVGPRSSSILLRKWPGTAGRAVADYFFDAE